MTALLLGLGLGVFVAAQPGPVSLLLLRTASRTPSSAEGLASAGRTPSSAEGLASAVRGSWQAAFAIGVAAACVDTAYAALGAAGAAPLLQWGPARLVLGTAGAVLLVVIGLRTLWSAWRVRAGLETLADVGSPRRAFLTGLAATASNPLTIASWAAIFAAASVAGTAASPASAALLVVGIGIGSLGWFAVLTLVATRVLHRLGERWTTLLDLVCGVGLVGFGALLGVRAATSEQ